MFINFSNHPSSKWMNDQLSATIPYGEVVDIPFPTVDPYASREDITLLASTSAEKILATLDNNTNNAVMVQGEMTLTYHIVKLLKDKNIKVVCACTSRNSKEYTNDKGELIKESIFEFVQFREY